MIPPFSSCSQMTFVSAAMIRSGLSGRFGTMPAICISLPQKVTLRFHLMSAVHAERPAPISSLDCRSVVAMTCSGSVDFFLLRVICVLLKVLA